MSPSVRRLSLQGSQATVSHKIPERESYHHLPENEGARSLGTGRAELWYPFSTRTPALTRALGPRFSSSPSCTSGVTDRKCRLSPGTFRLRFCSLLHAGRGLTSILCLNFTRENDITPVLDHTFCVEHNAFGRILQHELKPNGRNVPVTEDNKKEYVR